MCDGPRIRLCDSKIKPLKLTKLELSLIGSKDYWDGVFAEIEEKPNSVRKSYPFFPVSKLPTSTLITQPSDDIKFEISPPTPIHKSRRHIIKTKSHQFVNEFSKTIDDQSNDRFETVKLPSATFAKDNQQSQNELPKEIKIYPKDSCPRHSKASLHSVSRLPSLLKKTKVPCKHRELMVRSKSELGPITASSSRAATKAPKLSKASLLPSFAKPVSTDSSASSRQSFESEEDSLKVEPTSSGKVAGRDFLRVPNLRFVSSHPSFHKLSFEDSSDEESIDSPDISLGAHEQPLLLDEKNLSYESRLIDENQKILEKRETEIASLNNVRARRKNKFVDYKKKYACKALDAVTRYEHTELTDELNKSVDQALITSEESVELEKKRRPKKVKFEDENQPIPFRDIHNQLKSKVAQNPNLNIKIQPKKVRNLHSVTLGSSSRSTSGPSLDFQPNGISSSSTLAFKKIPEAKLYPRSYFNKCYACLYKPYESHVKIKREFPLTTLKSIVDDGPTFEITSSRSSTSSDESLDEYIRKYESKSLPRIIKSRPSSTTPKKQLEKIGSIDHPQRSFDSGLLSPSRSEPSSPKFASPAQSPQPDHPLKDRSLSGQSSFRSKTSSPSNQSSDSDENRVSEDKAPRSKHMAPCHAPVVWRKSLEPWRALRSKKFTSIKARAAALIAKSDDSDSDEAAKAPDKPLEASQDEVVDDEDKTKKTKKKKKKELMRVKTAEDMSAPLTLSDDDGQIKDAKAVKVLKRAKTTFDLGKMSDESSDESDEEEVNVVETVKAAEKMEDLSRFDIVLVHRAGSPPPSANLSAGDLAKIVENYLGDELFMRLNQKLMNPHLVDISHLNYLPPESYKVVSEILGLVHNRTSSVEDFSFDAAYSFPYADTASESDDETLESFGMTVHPPSSEESSSSYMRDAINPYALFLQKPRRKVVTWRPLTEEDLKGYDPEATLEMRVARLLDKICAEFCEWLKQLGDQDNMLDVETLKDMFEINFSAEACKATQVIIRQLPTVPVVVAYTRQAHKASELDATRKQLRRDYKVENMPKRVIGFNSALPNKLKFVPPKNRLSKKWRVCEHIPQDLESMDVLWNGIMHLDSVHAFTAFLQRQPKNATLLRNLLSRKAKV